MWTMLQWKLKLKDGASRAGSVNADENWKSCSLYTSLTHKHEASDTSKDVLHDYCDMLVSWNDCLLDYWRQGIEDPLLAYEGKSGDNFKHRPICPFCQLGNDIREAVCQCSTNNNNSCSWDHLAVSRDAAEWNSGWWIQPRQVPVSLLHGRLYF